MKSTKTLDAMKTVKKYLTSAELLLFLTANVYSRLYYASQAWLDNKC